MTSQETFQKGSQDFVDWFKSIPGTSLHPSLDLVDLRHRNAGRGIVANADIPADTDLFSIPRAHIISVENSTLSQRLPKLFTKDEDAMDEDEDENGDESDDEESADLPKAWLDLILVMIYEYLQGDASPWKPYLDILPQAEDFNTLMFWKDDEIAELQASAVRNRVGKKSADEMFLRRVVPVVKDHADVFDPDSSTQLSDIDLLALAHRMGSIIMAYAFDLEKDEDEEEESDQEGDGWTEDRSNQMSMGMVAMADMLNADAEFNAHLSHGDEKLTMTSIREIKAGEEVLNYYGPLANCELLRRYGYTSVKHARYDVVEIPWASLQHSIDQHFPGALYKNPLSEEEMQESFVLEREAGDPDETGINRTEARFTTFPEELVEQVNSVDAVVMKIDLESKLGEQDKIRLKQAFLAVIAETLDSRLREYASSMAEDEALVAAGRLAARQGMAVDVRLGEKRLLHEARELASSLMAKYQDQEKSSQPPAKRQKTRK